MPPLVSILIPAYNAEPWIGATLESALAQTCENKEIIVVDDGSADQTVAQARRYLSRGVVVLTQKNQGAAAARNKAFEACHGDYIQWLDADDLLAPDKIARQLAALNERATKRTLVSSAFGSFAYRTSHAKFTPTALWRDLAPLEWLLLSMEQNLYIQTTAWLVSRELHEAAGPWDVRLSLDDDGEYIWRVIMASDGVRFVPDAKAYYRRLGQGCLSHLDASKKKWESQFLSIQLHVRYLRSLPDSDRARQAGLRYMQDWVHFYYPDRLDLYHQLKAMARELGGRLEPPRLSWKYAWLRWCLGWGPAKRAQAFLPRIRWSLRSAWDKAWFDLASRNQANPREPQAL